MIGVVWSVCDVRELQAIFVRSELNTSLDQSPQLDNSWGNRQAFPSSLSLPLFQYLTCRFSAEV